MAGAAIRYWLIAAFVAANVALPAGAARAQAVTVYRGMCDASAAVALDNDYFVVASDEDNTLRVYRRGQPQPAATLTLGPHVGAARESDLEGAARVGDRIYWISSHGRNSSAKSRQDRYRFFATEVDGTTVPPSLKPPAAVQVNLLAQLVAAASLKSWHLSAAARLAPEAPGGLNIEGLAASHEGQLLIGFRNPVRDGKALVVTLLNPQQAAAGAPASFGPAIALDLGGRGVRSLERVDAGYLIVAGPTADKGDFALYRWSGQPTEAPRRIPAVALDTLRPEALFVWPQSRVVQVLSDDGGIGSGGVACKDRPSGEQAFRSIELRP
jgi:hypothetical protein